jgi:hypothetical protein
MTRVQTELRTQIQEQWIRAIVREEIVEAFRVLGRAAHTEGNSTESEIAERAASVLELVAGGVALRLTCPHKEYTGWTPDYQTCTRCGEPEPEPVNPFEGDPEGRTRECPVDPVRCAPLIGWEAFGAHVYEAHTEGEEAHRIEQANRLVKGRKANG